MSQTISDLGKLVKARYPGYEDLSDDELGRLVKAKYSGYEDFADPADAPDTPKTWSQAAKDLYNRYANAGVNVAKGAGKGVLSTSLGVSKMLGMVPKETTLNDLAVPFTGGQEVIGDPSGKAQQLGFYGEQLGEFFVPAGQVGRGVRAVEGAASLPAWFRGGATLATRAGLEAGAAGAVTAAQTGGDPNAIKTAAVIAGAIPVLGRVTQPVTNWVKQLASQRMAPRFIAQLIKPGHGELTFGRDPAGEVARQGLVANSLDQLMTGLRDLRNRIGQAIDRDLMLPANAARRIDVAPIINQEVDDAIRAARIDGNAGLVSRLEAFRKGQFLDRFGAQGRPTRLDLSPLDARRLKTSIGDSFKWSVDPIEGTVNALKQRIYGRLNSAIEQVVPGTRAQNAQYGNLLSAEKAAERRLEAMNRAEIFNGLSDKTTAVGTALLGAVFGLSVPMAAVEGLLLGTAKKAGTSTPGATRIAAELSRLTPEARTALANRLIPFLRNLGLEAVSTAER